MAARTPALLVRLAQPAPQLGERRIGPGRDLGADRLVQGRQLGQQVAALRAGRDFATVAPSAQHLGDIGHADPKRRRDAADGNALVRRRQNPQPQILRIRLPTPPDHPRLRRTQPETYESHPKPVPEAPSVIPVTLSML
jgi:hypothetical protein